MRKTQQEKLDGVLIDKALQKHHRELLRAYVKHRKNQLPSDIKKRESMLENMLGVAYTMREFAFFINKPFHEATVQDKEQFLEHKRNSKKRNGEPVTNSSITNYKFRIQRFYRWLKNHTPLEIDHDLAYPKPKIVKKKQLSLHELCQIRIDALLKNELFPRNNKFEDRKLTKEELQQKYAQFLLPEHHLQTLQEYYKYKIASGKVSSAMGIVNKLYFLKRLGRFLGAKMYKQATRQDIEEFIMTVKQKNKEFSPTYKAHLLDFYRFVYGMFGEEQPRKYPAVVSWLYTGRMKKINDKLPKEIIPDDEIKRMIGACTNSRDQAILAVLADCSARVGELIGVNIGDVKITQLQQEGAKHKHFIATIKLNGKTGERTNQLFSSVSYLRLWRSHHPDKDNKDAPLFIAASGSRYGQRLTRVGINKVLQRAAQRAEIKRHIHAHLFRHTNLTRMAGILSETDLKIHAGWGKDSNMASVYVHRNEKHVADKILESYGLKPQEKTEQKTVLDIQICPNTVCGYQNTGTASFCAQCGYPLRFSTAVKLKQMQEQEEKLHKELMSKPVIPEQVQGGDFKEMLYQLLKADPEMIKKLKDLMELAGKL